jgi:YD repeat-containing protein
MIAAGFMRVAAAVSVFAAAAQGQLQTRGSDEPLRVTVSLNQDGSRTTYEFDYGARKAVATTADAKGKVLNKIRYELDAGGRFETGQLFGADDKLRGKTRYKYDPSGSLAEETQLTADDVVKAKLVYAHDANGKVSGYSVYDGAGKLMGQTKPTGAAPAPASPAPKKKPR